MSTFSDSAAAPTGTSSPLQAWRLKALVRRAADAWKQWQKARADQHLDLHFRRTRGHHERYLSRASDHYELERLEQEWERRNVDVWRVY